MPNLDLKSISKILKPVIFAVVIVFTLLLFQSFSPVNAQDCTKINDPEFHSLRPYPAIPCNPNKQELSYICGNDMVLTDTITVPWTDGSCTQSDGSGPGASGTLTCSFDLQRGFTVEVDPSQSKLPIMGNTENVKSSVKATDDPGFEDVSKVNNYVSWYLNGITGHAEYGKNDSDYNLVNLSGPLKKLLPGAISDAQRIQSISRVFRRINLRQS